MKEELGSSVTTEQVENLSRNIVLTTCLCLLSQKPSTHKFQLPSHIFWKHHQNSIPEMVNFIN